MKIKQSPHRHWYLTGYIFIGILISVVLAANWHSVSIEIIPVLSLIGTGFFNIIRSFYLDRYLRLLDNREAVDYWTYYDETSNGRHFMLFVFIRPYLRKNANPDIEVTRKRLNTYTYLFYGFILCLILSIVLIGELS